MEWRSLFKEKTILAAEEFVDNSAVKNYKNTDGLIRAEVEGLDLFHVEIHYSNGSIIDMKCDCPYGMKGIKCKHLAATLLVYDKDERTKDTDVESSVSKEKQDDNHSMDCDNVLSDKMSISIESDDVINYAIQHNGVDIVRDVCLKNLTENDLEHIVLHVNSEDKLIKPFEYNIEKIRPDEEIHLDKLKVKINGDYLASLTERIKSEIKFSVVLGDNELVSIEKEIVVLAFDEWAGLKYTPELLAAFSMPNHPVIISLIQEASKYLEKWTQDPSLDGYQSGDPNRVKYMAAAAYAAIQKKNIVYANPPSSFELVGQRIRLADAILEQHLGTCLDMTLLYVACLEAMGLNPFMVMMQGHIFAGVWLIDESFSDTIMDDPSNIEKRMSNGIYELLVVECTAMNAGRTLDFDDAIEAARQNVRNYSKFAFAVDVTRARSMGIIPLPVRVKTENGYMVQHEERKDSEVTNAPIDLGVNFDLSNVTQSDKANKQTQWERKLLDLSLRNMLINLRFTKAVVPIMCNDVGVLEDNLTEGDEFHVLPRPDNMDIKGDGLAVEVMSDMGPFKDFIDLESKHKKLHSLYTEKELTACLTKMYRSAKSSMEENGASTLYLALGVLRWMEGDKTKTARYAPVILVPIDIVRKSANKGYSMRMRDEDAQLNITLIEFLKQNYDLKVVGLDPLPTDEHGLDIPKIFAILRRNVLSMEMWDVIEAAFIGNFAFSQFVMWNDIHNHSDLLEKNKIVRSLIKGAIDWDASIKESDYTDEAYLPITADGSQIKAINMAANGVSFVLHGPPGTGKSQTITAMIANALTKGKKVLFVAEKMAALEVVQRRLENLGIDDFCLELHSNKATKKAVLDQLRKNLEIGVWGFETEYEQRINDIRKMRADLDSYAIKLHTKRGFGKSLKELIDIYETIPDYGVELEFSATYASSVTRADLDNQKRLLEQLIATGRGIGHPENHPLSIVGQTVYTQTLKMEMQDILEQYKAALSIMPDIASSFTSLLDVRMPVSESDWRGLCGLAIAIVSSETIPLMFLKSSNIDKDFNLPLTYMAEKVAFEDRRNKLLRSWKETFLGMNMQMYRTRYDEANGKFFGKNKALSMLVSEIQSFAYFTVDVNQVPLIIADIEAYQRQEAAFKVRENQIPFEWMQIIESCHSSEGLQRYKENIKASINSVSRFYNHIKRLDEIGKISEGINLAKKLIASMDALEEREDETEKLLKVTFENKTGDWINDRIQQCDVIIQNSSAIKDWIVYKQMETECRKAGLDVVCDAYIDGLQHDQLMSIYLKSIYKAIILSVIETEPALNSFTGNGFNEKIAQFKKLDAEFMELTKEEMYYKLTHQLPTDLQSVQVSKELNILRRAISSNGRGLTIRSLFDQIPNILTRLCPCMLMSPISVAQYITMNNDAFDIVIFDEASQLPTCKAVGVLARGKNAVIVGDPNQMPPTSFFAGNTVDEDNLDIEDLDSILDDCLALGMPSAHLQWHYRSRHESLIAFSNHEFYENSMLTFPSMNDLEKKVGFVKVDGFFDRKRGRINEGEARAIVEEIKRRYKDETAGKESIGVVTFNISQQTLIEDMLQEEFQKDPEFDRWATNSDEPLFVKNLENVQGDERDIILFSITYGPDEEEKLSHNFGPLNKEGGWKRLNVAVSRARDEMVVFSIMTADMIDLRRTKAKGVESLKKFLEYAEKGELHLSYSETHMKKNQGMLDRICKELDEHGYAYKKSVGHSNFKVDIAVVNPYNKDEFILGIMLDGDSYRQSTNTKDREVAQFSVLENLGWKLHRMWTMDWWDNKNKEIDKLLSLLLIEKEKAYQVAKDNGTLDESFEDNDYQEQELSADYLENNISEQYINESVSESPDYEDRKVVATNEEQKNNTIKPQIEASEDPEIVKVSLAVLDLDELPRVADKVTENESDDSVVEDRTTLPNYTIETYNPVILAVTPLSTTDYMQKNHLKTIIDRLQMIIENEAPISNDRLIKKVLRSFGIARVSAATQEYTEKAIKKTKSKSNKQAGLKFFWREDQNPDTYYIFRVDADLQDKRSMDDISQQEIKNAICRTLIDKGPVKKDELIKETTKIMGYSRSGPAIVEAIERGIKYGRKTGEIIVDEDKKFNVDI